MTEYDSQRRRIALRLKELRVKSGHSQDQVAEKLGLSKQAIWKWEKPEEKTLPGLDYIEKLCEIYSCTPEDLLCMEKTTQYKGNGYTWILDNMQLRNYPNNAEITQGIELFNLISKPNASVRGTPFETMIESHRERLLDTVLRSKVIHISDVERNPELEARLQRYFGPENLVKCIVANIPTNYRGFLRPLYSELIACLGVEPILQELHQARSFGLTGGRVIAKWIERLPYGALGNISAYALMSVKTWNAQSKVSIEANALLRRLAYKNPDLAAHTLPFINLSRRNLEALRNATSEEKTEVQEARKLLSEGSNVDVALVSIGDIKNAREESTARGTERYTVFAEMNEEDQARVVGDILLRFIDLDGKPVGTPEDVEKNERFVFSIELKQLRNMAKHENRHVWLLADDPTKEPVVRAVINAGYINALVTTSEMANNIIK